MTTFKDYIVGVFENQSDAQAAVKELISAGFQEDQVGVAGKEGATVRRVAVDGNEHDTMMTEGAMAGVATGAGAGALWALAIAGGALPAIGPVIAGGLLASMVASAAGGAAVGGLVGAMIGMGVTEQDAHYYQNEFHEGRTIVTVRVGARYEEARRVLRRHDGMVRDEMDTRDLDLPNLEGPSHGIRTAAPRNIEAPFASREESTHPGPSGDTSRPHPSREPGVRAPNTGSRVDRG